MKKITIILFVLAIALTACGSDTEQAAEPEVVEVVKEVEVPVEKVVEKEVEVEVPVEVASQACLDALDAADAAFLIAADGFEMSGEALNIAADGFLAAANMDVAGLDAAYGRLEQVNAEMSAGADRVEVAMGRYAELRDNCRGDRA